jgi:hypothetical protein
MFPEHLMLLVTALTAGFGLTLVGLINLLAGRMPASLRVAGVALGCLISLAVAITVAGPQAGWITGLALAGGLMSCAALASQRFRSAMAAITQPAARWVLLAAAGLIIVGTGIAHFEITEQAIHDADMRDLDILGEGLQAPISEYVVALTDRGTRLELGLVTTPRDQAELNDLEERFLRRSTFDLKVIRRGPADEHANCHGWVFTEGRYHVGGTLVDQILDDNNYEPVTNPRPGDLVVYRQDQQVTHTAVVRYVTPGMPVMVEGKWGTIGVFLHPVDQSCYGINYTYYRSPRQGHLLESINTESTPRETTIGGDG